MHVLAVNTEQLSGWGLDLKNRLCSDRYPVEKAFKQMSQEYLLNLCKFEISEVIKLSRLDKAQCISIYIRR